MAVACALAAAALGQAACVMRTLEAPAAPYRPPRAVALEEVVAAYDGYCRGLTTWSAKGDLDVRDLRAGKARRIGVRVLAGRGGRLYLKGSVAVVTALEVVADGRRFWFRLPSKKTVWTGAAEATVATEATSDEAPYYALRPGDLAEAFLPEPLGARPGESVVMDGDRTAIAVSVVPLHDGRGLARKRVVLDRDNLRVASVLSYAEAGGLLREVRYADWRDGWPRRVLVIRPQQGYEAEFVLDEVLANVPLPERAFAERPAEGYTVVEVGTGG